ncbi:MAG: EAL domain-containing protein [Desulfovermiculus sp.]
MGKKVLAEGVERQDQVQVLQKMGCDYAQGFFFARPVPVEGVAALFLEKAG